MENSGALLTFLVEIGPMVKQEPDGRQVAAGHGVLQGRLLPCTASQNRTTERRSISWQ
jgi:hypothetical protein